MNYQRREQNENYNPCNGKIVLPDGPGLGVIERAKPGDVVLLAPACSSFDQFENYEARGRVFKQLVANLEGPFTGASVGKGMKNAT